ncbi:hypothetical protein [Candidatus Magnetomonas plexicatena]|uniref:hypothetical protein n=1 Tax=Candidatus Magnetomonas plexicatena TaxID=2552947 RepID=UPI0011016AC0|nr:hypothetical protein E2O03_000035 [Nitrospirales bacterium LBB_01]
MKRITAKDLERWADARQSEADLPELIKLLIFASAKNIASIRFPSCEYVNRAGWDGQLICSDGLPQFVPKGNSVWELSTSKDVSGKAWSDFDKRSSKSGRPLPADFEFETTTYVSVSLRFWNEPTKIERNSRDGFIKEAKSRNIWSDVKVLDATNLEDWIKQYTSVGLWLADLGVGTLSAKVKSIDEVWELWSNISIPPITESLILTEREEHKTKLVDLLMQKSEIIRIRADSPQEAQAFVISAIKSLNGNDQRYYHLYSRSIVVNDEETVRRLLNNEHTLLIIILGDAVRESAGMLTAKGHTVVIPLGNSHKETPDIFLKRPGLKAFANELHRSSNISLDDAQLKARSCRRSVTVFQRLYPSGTAPSPPWENNLEPLIPAIFAGAWKNGNNNDRQVIEALSRDKSYEEVVQDLHQFLSEDDPPILRIDDVWTLSAPVDSFTHASRLITEFDWQRFSDACAYVFSEIDPCIDLPANEKMLANITGKTLPHSKWLRDGLAQTLLLIAVHGDGRMFPHNLKNQMFVDELIRQLPGLYTNSRLLISLSQQLPVLVEAVPDPFVEALECLLQGKDEIAKTIFTDSDSPLWTSSPHTEILWALEMLAWDPQWLARVCIILTKLSEIDPGGTYSNRPINSLYKIFLPWRPGTNATLKERMEVIDLILRDSPEKGWNLITSLLPKIHESASPTYEPLWREAGKSQREVFTDEIEQSTYNEIINRVLDNVGNKPERWRVILDSFPRLTPVQRIKAYDMLESVPKVNLSEDIMYDFWELFREFTYKHKAFSDAFWALPGNEINRLQKIVESFEPFNLIKRYKWLFDNFSPLLPSQNKPEVDSSADLKSLRHEALKNIIKADGTVGILEFGNTVSFPSLISDSLIEYFSNLEELFQFIEKTKSYGNNGKIISRVLSSHAYLKYGKEWKKYLFNHIKMSNWDNELVANVILDWPDNMDTFSSVNSLGTDIENLYWSKRSAFINEPSKEICTFFIKKLIEVKRSVDMVHSVYRFASSIETELLIDLLDSVLEELSMKSESKQVNLDSYDVREIFDILRKRDNISHDKLLKLEYLYLPLLIEVGGKSELTLHKSLASEPEFFINIVCDVYKPSSGIEEETIDENTKARAQLGFRLLNAWKTPPGLMDDNSFDADKLKSWIEKTTELAKEKNRLEIADYHIGKVLAYVPDDPDDNVWPHKGVRDIFKLLNDKIEEGMLAEQLVIQGVYQKSINEGGEQERELSNKWKERAHAVGNRWPSTKALLNKIAKMWENQAEQEDIQAELRNLNR